MLFAAAAASAQAQPPDRLHDSVDEYSLHADSFIEALLAVSEHFQLPMGVEWVKTAGMLKPVSFSRTHTTAAEVLQQVVSTYVGYDWRMDDGIVHVFNSALNSDPHNPLNIKVAHLGPAGIWGSCRPLIVQGAEVWLRIGIGQVVEPGRGWGVSIGSGGNEPVLELPCKDVPVRYVLSRLVTATPRPIWVATFPEKSTLSPGSFFEELPPHGPDTTRTYWVMLPWGATPPGWMVR